MPAAYRARSGEWVGVTGRSRVLVYNTAQVPAADLPTSVFELTEPQWTGKVGVAPTNGSFQAFVTALRVQHGDDQRAQFLTDLKANGAADPREQRADRRTTSTTASSPPDWSTTTTSSARPRSAARRWTSLPAQLHFFPDGDTGALVNVSGVGVLRKAATDPDARALVDYLLGTAAQTYFAEQTYEYPLVAGVPTAPGLPAADVAGDARRSTSTTWTRCRRRSR